MREILLVIILVPLLVLALFRPLIGIYTYIWYALLRPDILAYTAWGSPYSSMIAAVTLFGLIRQLGALRFVFNNPIAFGLVALQLPMALSHWFAEVPWQSLFRVSPLDLFEKMILMCLVIPVLVVTARQLWWLLLIMGGSLGILGVKFGLFGLVAGGAVFRQGYGGLLSDNNDIALAFAMTIPLVWCMRRDIESKAWKLALLFTTAMLFSGIIMTHSRGGSLTLLGILLLIVMRSKQKLALVVSLAILIGPAIYLVRDSYVARISTLQDPTQEQSAMSRVDLAKAAIQTWRDYPFLGMGFGGRASRHVLNPSKDATGSVVHNTYLQMLADSGIFAGLIYVGLLWGTILWLEFSRRKTRRLLPHLANIPEAIQLSLIAFAIGATFLSRIQFDFTYMLLMAAASWWNVSRNELAALQVNSAIEVTTEAVLEPA